MKNKLSLSLLTCLAISYQSLNAALLKPEEICVNGASSGTACNISGKQEGVNITDTSIKEIISDNSKMWASGKTELNKLELKNNSLAEIGGSGVIGELVVDQSVKFTHTHGTTHIKKITSTTNNTQKATFKSNNGYLDIGDMSVLLKGDIKNIIFDTNGSVRFFNVNIDNSVEANLGFLYLESSELNETKITIARDLELKNNKLTNITLKAPSGLHGVAEKNIFIGGKIDAHGTYKGNIFTNTEVGLDTTGAINLNTNTFEGGKLKARGTYTNNTFRKDSNGQGTDINADAGGNMIFAGTNTFEGANIHKTSSNPTSHNIVINNNSSTTFTDSTLINLSINANSRDESDAKVTITGGTLNNVGIGTVTSKTNIGSLTLDGVSINNSGITGDNIIAQNLTLKNLNTVTNANFNVANRNIDKCGGSQTGCDSKLIIDGSNVDNTNKITATNAEIGSSTIGANVNVSKELKAKDGAKLDGSVTSGTIIAEANSSFTGNVSAINKITSNGASFDKEVKAAFLEANANSTFNVNSSVIISNKLTSDNSTFDGTVKASELETKGTVASNFNKVVNVTNTLTSTNANFRGNVTAGNIIANNLANFSGITNANTITANNGSVFNGTTIAQDSIMANLGSSFVGNVSATNKITSNGAGFDKEVKTAFLESLKDSHFKTTSIVDAKDINAVGSTFEGTIVKNNSIKADSSTFTTEVNTNILEAINGSNFKNVNANNITVTNSTFGGITTVTDTITANIGANFTSEVNSKYLMANDGSIFNDTSTVNVSDSIIANAGSKFHGNVKTDFLAAETGAEFKGTTNVRQLYANGSNFGGTVTIGCENPTICGSVIDDSVFNNLELKSKTEAIIDAGSRVANLTLSDEATAKLDRDSSVTNLTLTTTTNKVTINGASKITGAIKNEGTIEVNNGTISSAISGGGKLITKEVIYKESVSLSEITGSGSTYKKDATAIDSAEVDNSNFEGNFTINGKLTAYQGNTFNKVIADSANFLYDVSKGINKNINAKDVAVTKDLIINNINVKSDTISANTATIKNNAMVESVLKGKDDIATKVYDKDIIRGNAYNIDNSTTKGGIRTDKLNTTSSSIHGQIATNTLNATNTTFYIYGNGIGKDDSFYKGYSGAIIAREGAIGGGNSIQLANTNLSNLTQGFVPIAIVKKDASNGNNQGTVISSKSATKLATTSGVDENFFRVTYKSKLALYELVDKYKHFDDINGNYVWSVGVSGDNLVNSTNIDDVISGVDTTNIANGKGIYSTSSLEVEVGDMFKAKEFDKEAIDTANFILTSPDYVIRTKNNTLNKRFRALKDYKLGNGFWLDTQMGYAKYEYNAIHYKNMSAGVDKTQEFNNSDFTLGLTAGVGNAETKGNLNSDADSKSFGIYVLNKFNNNVFVGASAFYHRINSSYEAKMLDVKANKSHNVYKASIESGIRFGDDIYFEPSLNYHLTSYKPTAINQKGLVLKGDRQLKHELGLALEGGYRVPNVLDTYLAVSLSKELNHKPDLIFIDELKIQNKVDGNKGDTSVGINLGVDYKLSHNASLNIDLGSNLYTNSDKEIKGNIGVHISFNP